MYVKITDYPIAFYGCIDLCKEVENGPGKAKRVHAYQHKNTDYLWNKGIIRPSTLSLYLRLFLLCFWVFCFFFYKYNILIQCLAI